MPRLTIVTGTELNSKTDAANRSGRESPHINLKIQTCSNALNHIWQRSSKAARLLPKHLTQINVKHEMKSMCYYTLWSCWCKFLLFFLQYLFIAFRYEEYWNCWTISISNHCSGRQWEWWKARGTATLWSVFSQDPTTTNGRETTTTSGRNLTTTRPGCATSITRP